MRQPGEALAMNASMCSARISAVKMLHPVDQVLRQKARVAVLKQPAQAPVADRANDHAAD